MFGFVFNLFHHHQKTVEAGFAGLWINLSADFIFLAIARFGGFGDGFFHRFQHDGFIDGFFSRHRIGDLQKL